MRTLDAVDITMMMKITMTVTLMTATTMHMHLAPPVPADITTQDNVEIILPAKQTDEAHHHEALAAEAEDKHIL